MNTFKQNEIEVRKEILSRAEKLVTDQEVANLYFSLTPIQQDLFVNLFYFLLTLRNYSSNRFGVIPDQGSYQVVDSNCWKVLMTCSTITSADQYANRLNTDSWYAVNSFGAR